MNSENFIKKLGTKYLTMINNDPDGLPGIYLDYLCDVNDKPEAFRTAMWNEIIRQAKKNGFII